MMHAIPNPCYNGAKECPLSFTLHNLLAEIDMDEVVDSIVAGLTSARKHISSIYFYDAAGSKLFEEITRLPEYYPTRIEKQLLHRMAPLLFDRPNWLNIIEIGSGDCSKISILLDAVPMKWRRTIRYLPVDVSREAIRESADLLQQRFPGIKINGVVADFTRQMHLIPRGRNHLFCFLGSTIGNLSVERKNRFFLDLSRIMLPGDALLLGVDLIKPVDILERAYNDSQGVTAAFNRNILKVVNQLAGTDFEPPAFDHLAFYNHRQSRIEMHLRAGRAMRISSPAMTGAIQIREGETIHTENSHKFTLADIQDSAATAGLAIRQSITDDKGWFALVHFHKK